MTSLLPWLLGAVVLLATGLGLWSVFLRRTPGPQGEQYLEALEAWIDGDLPTAEHLLRRAVQDDPDSIDPFLQLGNLLRLQGDPKRAAVLHRGLTVRSDLPEGKKALVGLALAEDLLALRRWEDAKQTLDTLSGGALNQARYRRARFQQLYGMGNLPDAARVLKQSIKQVAEQDRPWFTKAYINFQLDRALTGALAGDESVVNPRIKDVARYPAAEAKSRLVRALLAATQGDAARSLALGAEGLMDSPRELAIFLPVLQGVLLESGHYSRSIPLLENACRAENAPPSLWVDLALLYEKLGQRENTLRLLESKRGRPDFTPDVAAPILRKLVAESPGTDMERIWSFLCMPRKALSWSCSRCGADSERVIWFCPDCHEFDSYELKPRQGEVR